MQILMYVFVFGAMGPYLVMGIRTEQVVIYGLLILALASADRQPLARSRPSAFPILLLMSLLIFYQIVSSVLDFSQVRNVPLTAVLAALDNSLLPILVLLLGALWLTTSGAGSIVSHFCRAVVVGMTINSLVVLVQILHPDRTAMFLRHFWTQDQQESVAELIIWASRYTGVFNQPSEAAIAYCVAVVAAVFLVRTAPRSWYIALLVIIPMLVWGAVMTGSKIFLLGGLPILFFSLLLSGPYVWRRMIGVSVTLTAAGVIYVSLFGVPQTLQHWYEWMNIQGGLTDVAALTAGRFGGASVVTEQIKLVMNESPISGLGLHRYGSGWADSEWMRVIGTAGFMGLCLYLLVIVLLCARLITNATQLDAATWMLAAGLLTLLVGASFGLPTLSSNKSGALLTMGIALTLGARLNRAPKSRVASSKYWTESRPKEYLKFLTVA